MWRSNGGRYRCVAQVVDHQRPHHDFVPVGLDEKRLHRRLNAVLITFYIGPIEAGQIDCRRCNPAEPVSMPSPNRLL
jgi:hypothetical protein